MINKQLVKYSEEETNSKEGGGEEIEETKGWAKSPSDYSDDGDGGLEEVWSD